MGQVKFKGYRCEFVPFLKKWCINLSQGYSVPISHLQISMDPKDDQNSTWLRRPQYEYKFDVLDALKKFVTGRD